MMIDRKKGFWNRCHWLDRLWIYFVLGIIACTTMAIFWIDVPWNVGVDGDGLICLTAAQNLANGKGLQWLGEGNALHPLVHYPPLYSAVLAVPIAIGASPFQAATGLSILLLGMNTLLVGWVVHRFSQNKKAALVSAVIFAISPFIWEIHQMALSEPLFILWLMLSLGFLVEYIQSGRRAWLVGAACLAALAYLTRQVGVSLVATGILAILILRNISWRHRIIDAFIYALIAAGPTGIWYLHNIQLTGTATNRVIAFHPLTWATRKQAIETLVSWFYPGNPSPSSLVEYLMAGALAFVLIAWFIITFYKIFVTRHNPLFSSGSLKSSQLIATSLLFIPVYGLSLLVSLTFFDASTRLDNRILSPIYIFLLVAGTIQFARLSWKWQLPAMIIYVFLVAVYLPSTNALLNQMRTEGIGFSSKTWQQSKIVEYVRHTAPDSLLYSNDAIFLEFMTGKSIQSIPEAYDPVKAQPQEDYSSQLELMRLQLRQPWSALVLFTIDPNLTTAYRSTLSEGFQMVVSSPDGIVFADPDNVQAGTLP